MGFVAETGSGHVVVMDGAPDAAKPENGGRNLAPRPMELLLSGLGGCAAYECGADPEARPPSGGRQGSVAIEAERAETYPKVFTRIHMQFTIRGQGHSGQRRRARGGHEPRQVLFGQPDAGQDRGLSRPA